MSFYTNLLRTKSVDLTYLNPTLPQLLDAFERQTAGKRIAVFLNKTEKRTSPLGKDALETVKTICRITAKPNLLSDKDKLEQTVLDLLALRGAVLCESCMPDETVPAEDGVYLFCGDKSVYTKELIRSARRPWC